MRLNYHPDIMMAMLKIINNLVDVLILDVKQFAITMSSKNKYKDYFLLIL
jgi:hypothetical protein